MKACSKKPKRNHQNNYLRKSFKMVLQETSPIFLSERAFQKSPGTRNSLSALGYIISSYCVLVRAGSNGIPPMDISWLCVHGSFASRSYLIKRSSRNTRNTPVALTAPDCVPAAERKNSTTQRMTMIVSKQPAGWQGDANLQASLVSGLHM